MNTLRHVTTSYVKALFGIAPVTPEQQERDRLTDAVWEHWRLRISLRCLEKSLRRLDKSLANIKTKIVRARQQGHENELLRLAVERTRTETSRAATEDKRGQVSRKMEALRDWIRYVLRRP